jgi:hypothetical protein
MCLNSIHHLTQRYFYHISAEKSIPGSLSYLLIVRKVDLVEIFKKICSFYNEKKVPFNLESSKHGFPQPLI